MIQSKSNRFKAESPFCSDPDGNRIFGESLSGDEEITCKCSRKRWEMENLDDKENEQDGCVIYMNFYVKCYLRCYSCR